MTTTALTPDDVRLIRLLLEERRRLQRRLDYIRRQGFDLTRDGWEEAASIKRQLHSVSDEQIAVKFELPSTTLLRPVKREMGMGKG